MALVMERDTGYGISLEEAYIKVENTSGNKELLYITVLVFLNDTARKEGKSPIEQYSYSFVPKVTDDAPNYHKQAYEYLKSLPEYADAIDVLE